MILIGITRKRENTPESVICQAGVIDSFAQSLTFHYMALNQADVSKVMTGPLNSYSYVHSSLFDTYSSLDMLIDV
jgi:hypothetical protein